MFALIEHSPKQLVHRTTGPKMIAAIPGPVDARAPYGPVAAQIQTPIVTAPTRQNKMFTENKMIGPFCIKHESESPTEASVW